MRPLARTVLAAALAAAALPAVAEQGQFSRTVFFGDSLSDAGYYRPVLIQSIGPSGGLVGQSTTNPGFVWAQHLAEHYGTNGAANGNGQTGDNYAVSGARVAVDTLGALGPTPSTATQVQRHLAGGRADPDALYTLWTGANDVFAIAAGAPAEATLASAVTAQVGLVGTLQAAGARYIMVPTLPDMGQTPAARAQGAVAQGQLTALATAYNGALYNGINSAGLRVIPLNTFGFLQEVIANPGEFGFRNVTAPACTVAQSITCNPGTLVAADAASAYLFADGVHPTTGGHRALADFAISVLEAPAQIAVLPQSAAVVGRARAERVAWHVDGTPGAEGSGVWFDLRGDYQRYGDGDHYDGFAPALTVGFDWTRGNTVFGVFGGYGVTKQDWGLRRGDFRHRDATIGGFAGWYGDNGAWVNGQLSWSSIDIDTHRRVQLGQAVRWHEGSADGENLTAAVHAGWNFAAGNLRHGPVVGLVSQRIDVDGFDESDPSRSTALGYPDQSFDSMVGSVGWQVAFTEGMLRPYARATWDREFEDAPEEAFARVLSLPATSEFAVPGLRYDDSYATVTLGARAGLYGMEANFGLSTTLSHADSGNSTVFVSLNRSF